MLRFKPNGCGPKGLGWLIPNLWFKEACDRHDKMWARGIKQSTADAMFYSYMRQAARIKTHSDLERRIALKCAKLYYNMVKYFGRFFYGKKSK